MSSHELERVEVMGRVKRGDLKLIDAAVMLELSYRQVKRLWQRYREAGGQGLKHGNAGRSSNRRKPMKRHLSRKLCLRDSCRDLEAGLKHGVELVKYTSAIASQALPLTLLERRDGEAELELKRVLGVEVPTTVTSHDFQLAIDGLDDSNGIFQPLTPC